MKHLSIIRVTACVAGLVGTLATLPVGAVQAQDLTGRWRVGFRTGLGVRMNSGTEISSGGVETRTKASGLLGVLELSHWFSEGLAGTLSAGVLSVGTEARIGDGAIETRTASVMPFFIGVRSYMDKAGPQSDTRFFGSVEVGPVTGHEVASSIGTTVVAQTITRTALGGRLGVGADVSLGSRVMLVVGAGFDLMTDFSDPIGGQKNHSGADFGLGLGVLFGG